MVKRFLLMLGIVSLPLQAMAQVTVPNTFVTGGRILASEMNANFSALSNGVLNRAGGTITGNISVDSGITIDGVDVGALLGGTGTPTFSTVTATGAVSVGGDFAINTNKFTIASASGNATVAGTLSVTGDISTVADLTVGGSLITGSGSVALTTAAGKITALSADYLDDLDGTNLTGLAKLASTNTFTGRNDFKGYTETKSTANPSAGAITYDLSAGTHFETALSGNATVTISNVPASGVASFTVKFTADGTLRDFTWPGSVVWAYNNEIIFTSTNGKRDFITFITYDAGTTWYAFIGGQNF